MMTKWDTIQEDVKDQYAYLDEQEEQEDDDDIWGHEMSLEELAEEELELDEEYN